MKKTKERLERLGCVVWALGLLIFSGVSAWQTYKYVIDAKVSIIVAVLLSVVVGIVVLIITSGLSFLILIASDKNYDNPSPDFSAKV